MVAMEMGGFLLGPVQRPYAMSSSVHLDRRTDTGLHEKLYSTNSHIQELSFYNLACCCKCKDLLKKFTLSLRYWQFYHIMQPGT